MGMRDWTSPSRISSAQGLPWGDIVTVSAGSYTGDMPYLNGYYVDRGDAMLRAYPGHDNIALCIN